MTNRRAKLREDKYTSPQKIDDDAIVAAIIEHGPSNRCRLGRLIKADRHRANMAVTRLVKETPPRIVSIGRVLLKNGVLSEIFGLPS